MKKHLLSVAGFVMDYTRRLADGIPEEQMVDQPHPGMNTPAWVLGHLAIAYDFGLVHTGGKLALPREWLTKYGPGSSPLLAEPRHSKAELLAAVERTHAALVEAVRGVDEEQLTQPHDFEPMKKVLPTRGDMLVHLLTTHAVSHLGQLSAWRRIKGLPAVLGF